MRPQRIQRRREKGWTMPSNTIVVDRSTKWGNPFPVGFRGMTRAESLLNFRALLSGYINVTCGVEPGIQELYVAYLKQNLHRLKGKNLACWCRLSDECHADLLLKLANSPSQRSRSEASSSCP